jgi:hypothetical protein
VRRSIRIELRRLAIVTQLEVAGKWAGGRAVWIPARHMADLLAEKCGIKSSHVTVLKDYATLSKRTLTQAHSLQSTLVLSQMPAPATVRGVVACVHTNEGSNQMASEREAPARLRLTRRLI